MRIARALALAGIDARRKCEAHILRGEVAVNGEVVLDLGRRVDPEQDEITFRGRVLETARPVYYLLNKPPGYTTTVSDPHAGKTVYDLLPAHLKGKTRRGRAASTRVFPVGRLDKRSAGLLLFTNDGALAHRLLHPRFGVAKWYEARLHRALDPPARRRLLNGIRLGGETVRAERVEAISLRRVRVLIREGKKREVRRMFAAVGIKVIELVRTAFGPLTLGRLRPGQGRFLTAREAGALRAEGGRLFGERRNVSC